MPPRRRGLNPSPHKGPAPWFNPIGNQELEALDVWMLKSQPARFEVAHVAVDAAAPKRPETLVLRAVEALRAGLLQMDWAARKRRVEPVEESPNAPAPVLAVRQEGRQRVGVELGAVGILKGTGPALLPTMRLGWAVRPWLAVQASVAGLGTRPSVRTAAGSARVAQQYALVGASYRLRSELSDRFFMTLAAHAQLAEPYVVVRILDAVGATSGHPDLLVFLTLGTWL